MSNDDEKKVVICLTVQMGRWNPKSVAEGSIEKNCSLCGTPVFLSQSGQKMLAEVPDLMLVCMPCMPKLQQQAKAEGEDLKFGGALPGALEEALDNIRRQEDGK